MPLFYKPYLEYIATTPKDKPYMTLEEFIKSRSASASSSASTAKPLTEVGTYDEEDFLPTLLPLGGVSFHQWKAEGSEDVKLLTKVRYRRRHDYDMWIDLEEKVIYVENGNDKDGSGERVGIYQALGEKYGCSFDVKFHIPKEKFNLVEK